MGHRYHGLIYFAAGLTSAASAALAIYILTPRKPLVFPAPFEVSADIADHALGKLPYPPTNFIAGARDVETPYGRIRLYEWGRTSAKRKVLLLHGISGSCIVLLTLAEKLASSGCRVMLLDLFGRGWSGGPSDVPYDGRLYSSQIFMCLASSTISWTAGVSRTFSIVGYSLGGGIAADFASWFPDMIEDLVLIAPGGLMQSDWRSRMLYSGLVPEKRMRRILRGRLLPPLTPSIPSQVGIEPDLAADEAAGQGQSDQTILERVKNIDADAIVAWQLDQNPGFVQAFVSSIRYAPTKHQHDRWRRIGEHIRTQHNSGSSASFTSGSVMLVLGGQDSIIKPSEIVPEATEVLGHEQLDVHVFEDAGHSVAMSHGEDIADLLQHRWQLSA